MKQKIIIKNFSILKDIEIDINKFNIVIGEQTSGKSLLATIYNFYLYSFGYLEFSYQTTILSKKISFIDLYIEYFKHVFPEYFWNNNEFEIIFYYDTNFVKISYDLVKLNIFFSDYLYEKIKEFETLNNQKSEINEKSKSIRNKKEKQKLWDDEFKLGKKIHRYFEKNLFNNWSINTNFVHAGRLNIFLMVQDYSSKYLEFNNFIFDNRDFNYHYEKIDEDLKKDIEKVLKGVPQFEDKKFFIDKTQLSDSSSGQQESLPLISSLVKNYYKSEENIRTLVIEEPETHLFPLSQKKIVELMVKVYNYSEKSLNFFITTHSPYILTSFNNLIQADNTYKSVEDKYKTKKLKKDKCEDLKEKVLDVYPLDKHLNYDEISVYLIENGLLKDIKNYETKLIDASIIDEVSNKIFDEFDKLMDIKYERE